MSVTAPVLSADSWVYDEIGDAGRADVCALLRRHGFNPNEVHAVGYDLIDCPLLRVEVFLMRDGQVHVEHNDATCPDPYVSDDPRCINPGPRCEHIAMRTVDVLLRGELPEWWQPEAAT